MVVFEAVRWSSRLLGYIVWTGYLYDDFTAQSDFEQVATYARELGCLLWESDQLRKVFVTSEGHPQIR